MNPRVYSQSSPGALGLRRARELRMIRLLLVTIPPILRDVLRNIFDGQPDMEVVGEFDDGIDLLLAAGRTRADVVIVGLENTELPGICSHLLVEHPHIKILGVTADGRKAFLYELQPLKQMIGEISSEGLVAAVRSAMSGSAGPRSEA